MTKNKYQLTFRFLTVRSLVLSTLLLTFGSQFSVSASGFSPAACQVNDAQTKAYKDAAAAVRAVLEKMNLAKTDAETINTALAKITVDENMVAQFERVADTLEAGVAGKNGRFTPLRQAIIELEGKRATLKNAYEPFRACDGDTSAPPAVVGVINEFKALDSTIDEQLKTEEKLKEAVKSVPEKAQQFLKLAATKAEGAVPLGPILAPQTLRTELAKTLPDLARALRIRRQFAPIAERIAKALDPAVVAEIKPFIPQKPAFTFDAFDAALKPGLAKATNWAAQTAQVARDQQSSAHATLVKAMRDPFRLANEAVAAASVATDQRREFLSITAALITLLNDMQREDIPAVVLPTNFIPGDARELSNSIDQLQGVTALFARTILELTDVEVDKSTWTMASVDLFYFDNVERLIRVLAPNARQIGGSNQLQGDAREARRELNEKSQLFNERQAEVSDARQAVAKASERLRLATSRTRAATRIQSADLATQRRTADRLEANERALTQRRKNFEARQNQAQRRVDQAQTALDADPENLERQQRLEAAKRELDGATLLTDNAKADEERARDQADAARAQADEATTDIDAEVTDLKAELSRAETALTEAEGKRTTATTELRTAMREAFLSAQAENFAFAQARDNLPFWTNLAEPRSPTEPADGEAERPRDAIRRYGDSDPLSRVLLFAFPDSRTIFMRGARDDLDLVRQIIKEFDEPQGQAMMTLRTMEINSDGSKSSAESALKFLTEMDQQLIGAQSKIEEALATLRNLINQQVVQAGNEYKATLQTQLNQLGDPGTDKLKERKRDWLRFQIDRTQENQTVGFYDEAVLRALGWRKEFLGLTVDTNFLNAVIPPPYQTVNLAQALIVLTLASPANRDKVACKLDAEDFPSLRRFLGVGGNTAEVLGFQARLIEALRFNGLTHVLELAEAKIRLQNELEPQLKPLEETLNMLGADLRQFDAGLTKLRGDLQAAENAFKSLASNSPERPNREKEITEIKIKLANLQDDIQAKQTEQDDTHRSWTSVKGNLTKLKRDIPVLLSWLQGNSAGAAPELLLGRIKRAIEKDGNTSRLLLEAVGLRHSARFRFSQANESAVNLTFRRYLEQVNRDLSEAIVKPTFRELNKKLLKEKLGVGVIQETSILASNRLVARVDPRGSAQLAVGEEKNVLEAAINLTNLFGIAGKGLVTSAAGNPLALAGSGGGSSILSSAQSVLGALDQLPRDAPPAVYGIATGNLFEVTPVIDPSGQALRFRFDLVSATQIREPNDTINPQLPRIERHSVNTEVQLADQEIRLISQFQANSRLGIAEQKSGGLPILKYIRGVKEVPLIGWFVKRGGRAGQTQQSFIFCQTTMYPTLSEVLDIAVRAPSLTGLETP